jgi:hypothetical protein
MPSFTAASALPPIVAIRSCCMTSATKLIAGFDRDKVSDDDNEFRHGCIGSSSELGSFVQSSKSARKCAPQARGKRVSLLGTILRIFLGPPAANNWPAHMILVTGAHIAA